MRGFLIEKDKVTAEYGLEPGLVFTGHTPSTGRIDIRALEGNIAFRNGQVAATIPKCAFPFEISLSDSTTLRFIR